MSKTDDFPMTPAIRVLKAAKTDYTAYQYPYEPHGGTAQCAREMGIDENHVIKTIVLKTSEGKPFVMLMHGDCEISLNKLARVLGVKSVETCEIDEAEKNSMAKMSSEYFIAMSYWQSLKRTLQPTRIRFCLNQPLLTSIA